MSGALFPRVKTWGATDTLLASDLNAEFDNILNNFLPTMIQGYSVNVAQMQVQTAPGGVGSESLATQVSGEIERLRFQLAAIQGTTYWYQTPASSILSLNNALGASAQANKVSTGRVTATAGQPMFLIPDGTTNRVTAAGLTTPLVYAINGVQYTISTNVVLSGLTVAPTTANTVTINDTSITSGQTWTQLMGENGSLINVNAMGASVSALQGKIAAFKTPAATAEYYVARVQSTTQLSDAYRGYFFNQSDVLIGRQNITNGESHSLMQLTWIYATTAGALTAVYTNPTYSPTAPSSPAIGDYWFDMTNNFWKTYNGSAVGAANATLIGQTIQDGTKCVAARSLDFFAAFTDQNSVELYLESTTQIRNRYANAQVSVYGTQVSYPKGYVNWTTTTLDSGTSLSAGNFYYLYVSPTGNPLVSSIAPFDRRSDLRGFYHPSATYRCLGYVYYNAVPAFAEIESFYRANPDYAVSSITQSVNNYPQPFIVPPRQQLIECNATSGAITQILPHPSQWKSQRLVYVKTDATANLVNIQCFGVSVLSTTANLTQGNTNIGTLAASAGLSAGVTYLISGQGIPWGTTATWAAGVTATASQSSYVTTTGTTVTFATVPVGSGIFVGTSTTVGQFSVPLATQNESVELMSDGTNIICLAHNIPSQEIWVNGLTITASSVAPTKGVATYDNFYYQRQGSYASYRYDGKFAAGVAGTGDYQFTLPSPINNIDLSRVQANATVLGSTTPVSFSIIGSGLINGNNAALQTVMHQYVMSATQFKVYLQASGVWGSGVSSLSTANIFTMIGRFPVLNWWG